MGKNGSFQFNHVRLDKDYKWPILLGVCPNEILFEVYEKEQVVAGGAGALVNMAEGQTVTGKITKPLDSLRSIGELVAWAGKL